MQVTDPEARNCGWKKLMDTGTSSTGCMMIMVGRYP